MADIFDFYVYDDRSIQFAIAEPIMLEDKDVTQFRFRIPKVLNNIDMTDWEWWFIFVNAKKVKYTTQLTLTDDEDDPDNYSNATYTVGYGFSGYVGSVSFSIEALNVSGEEIVNEWHTKTYSTAVIDTLQGLRAVIPEPDGQVSTGITEEVKQALLQIARKVAYIDEHGQTYYNALYDALYAIIAVTVSPRSISLSAIGQTSQLTAQTTPAGGTITWSTSNASVATVSANGLVTATGLGSATITATSGGKSGTCSVLVAEATLTEISAVYTPSGTVYESDSLDSLKSRLVVTAHWSNGTTSEVASADYTLSGTLTTGTSTVTVSYGGMTTTFEVTVVGLTGITATYTQSGTVYDTASLDDLKSDLVVTANYSDGTSATVTDYTLSGTLTEGTSVVTVSYGGKTATFNVTVSHFTINAINLPYGAYVDTEYVPTAFNLKYLIGVQYLNADYDYTKKSRPFAGVNRLPASTTATEVYWHVYFMNGTGNNTPQNSQAIQYGYNAYPAQYTIQRRTANGDTSANVSNLTTTPFYFFVSDGESKIRANEELTESLVTGTFASTDAADSLTATTAEAPIDSFWLGKVNQCGSKTIAEFEGGVKIFCFKVWDENDNLLVNMHPAMSGSAIGMYDSVRNKFCEAQGTGAYLS